MKITFEITTEELFELTDLPSEPNKDTADLTVDLLKKALMTSFDKNSRR